MKSRHASVITLLVFLLTMSGAILFAQQPPNAHERSVKSQDDSIDVVVRHGNPATRLVETIENSVRIIKNEPIVTESLDDAKVPAELGEETKQPEQTPVQMMHSVHVEWYSYRRAAAVRSPRAWSIDDSIDVVVRHGNPATRLVKTIENSVRIIKNEPIVTESLDDAKVPAELGEETKQPEQTPVQMMHSVHVEWYSYRSAAAVRSPRAWSVHHNRATAYHPQSFTYHPTRFRGYTPKRDWTYHPKRDWTYHPKRDWTYHPKRD